MSDEHDVPKQTVGIEEERVDIFPGKTQYEPIYLALEITTYCNLNCSMCFKRGIKEEKPKHMTFEEFKHILDNVKPKMGISFIGLGEPLLNPEFEKMLKEAKKRGLGINFVTNGVLLTEKWSEKIIRYGVNKLSISFDGATKETYEKIRRNSNFEKVKKHIKQLCELKKTMNSDLPHIRMDNVLMTSNIEELPDIVKLAGELGADSLNTLHPQALTPEIAKEHIHNMSIDRVKNIYNKAKVQSFESKVNLALRTITPKADFCYTPWINPYVDVNGDIYACCLPGTEKITVTEYYKDSPVEINNRNLCFGNLLKEDFNKLWNGLYFNEFRLECLYMFKEEIKEDWSREKYNNLRKKNPCPKNPCKTCGVRFGVIC